jgi:hypothetical protein
MSLEQLVVEKLRVLAPNQQQDVLAFIESLQLQEPAPPTQSELRKANEIIARGIARAQNTTPQSPELIWQRFDAIRRSIAGDIEEQS